MSNESQPSASGEESEANDFYDRHRATLTARITPPFDPAHEAELALISPSEFVLGAEYYFNTINFQNKPRGVGEANLILLFRAHHPVLRKNVNFSVRQLKVPDVSGTFTIIDDDGEEEEAENQRIHDLFPRVGADYDYMHRERMRGWDSVYHEIRHDMEADIVEVLMKEHFVIEKGEREKLVLYDENESMGLMKAIDELELGRTTTEQFRSFKEKAKSWKANRVEVTGYKAADGA